MATALWILNFLITFIAPILAGPQTNAVYFTKYYSEPVLSSIEKAYGSNLVSFSSDEDVINNESIYHRYFFHSDDEPIPKIRGIGRVVNIYFYINTDQQLIYEEGIAEILSTYDVIFVESMEDLKYLLDQINPVLVKLADKSKYVPLIRILKRSDDIYNKITSLVRRIDGELPFKEYVLEALPIFKTKALTIEPKDCVENVAVIFESAVHPTLELCIRNVMYYLKRGWSLIVYHSKENEYFIKHALKDLQNVEYRIPENPIYSVAEYNKYMLRSDFYKSLNAKKVLIFQTDSIMLKEGMQEFMKYDYAGAPWAWYGMAGNGGFSLRSVDVMIQACIEGEDGINVRGNEDVYFSNFVAKKYNLIPYQEAYKFSREHRVSEFDFMSAEKNKFDGHLALHQTWLALNPELMRKILNHSLKELKATLQTE